MGVLGKRHEGLIGVYVTMFGYIPVWLAYTIYMRNKEGVSVFSSKVAFSGLILRGLTSTGGLLCVYGAFLFSNLAGINMGVIATTLTIAIFFSALNFYIVYKELLSVMDWLGAFLIISGVSIIGFFRESEESSSVVEHSAKYTWIAIFLGISASFIIGATSIMQRYYIKTVGFTPF